MNLLNLIQYMEKHMEKSNESEYFKSYLILSKLKAKGIDIDKLLEE